MPILLPLVVSTVEVGIGAAAYAAWLKYWAKSTAESYGYNDITDPGGSFRHTLASAELTRVSNEGFAKYLGDKVETFKKDNFLPSFTTDRNQDLWNNKYGRTIGKGSETRDEVVEKVKKAVEDSMRDPGNGPLVVDDKTDSRVTPENFPKELIPSGFPDSTADNNTGGPFTDPTPNWNIPVPGDQNANGIPDIHESIKQKLKQAAYIPSPIALDLDGDGVETVAETNGVYFDHNANGKAESTGWVGKDDGLLVRDLNANGKIDNGKELFGSETLLADGNKAPNGFAALVELDLAINGGNADGKIDAQDTAFASLNIWQDANSDGVTDAGELKTLAELGVQSISLDYNNTNYTISNPGFGNSNIGYQTDNNGNEHRQLGSYTKLNADGSTSTQAATDVWFKANPLDSITTNPLAISDEIAALPNIQGYGNLKDLHQAMAENAALKALVTQFTQTTMSSNNRNNLIDSIIYTWAGVQDIDPKSRAASMIYGNAIGDARKLEALEEFIGEEWFGIWCWGTRDHNPHGRAAPVLLGAYNELADYVYARLAMDSFLAPIYDQIIYVWDETTESVNADLTNVAQLLKQAILDNRAQGLYQLQEFIQSIEGLGLSNQMNLGVVGDAVVPLGEDAAAVFKGITSYVYGTAEGEILTGSSKSDYINALGGNDTIAGGIGDDVIIAGDGDDIVSGDTGNDDISGGVGNDMLNGGAGSDRYRFGRGDGIDTISESEDRSAIDSLYFGAGIASSDIDVKRINNDLRLKIVDTDDEVLVKNYFLEQSGLISQYSIENIVFADGAFWNRNDVFALILKGSEAADVITGFNTNDVIKGFGGNDIIDGGLGNDSLDGGTGNDVLDGAAGPDTYTFGRGDGQDIIVESGYQGIDTIAFKESIAASDIAVDYQRIQINQWLTKDELKLTIKDTGDSITISPDGYSGLVENVIEQIIFADGTTWNQEDVKSQALLGDASDEILRGFNNRDDFITGAGGNDNLKGLTGNDTLVGGAGDDTLAGGLGSDIYHIGLGDGQDLIIDTDNGVVENAIDTLVLSDGITPTNITVRWTVLGDLKITLPDGSSTTIRGQSNFNWLGNSSGIEQVKFADGTAWDYAEIANQAIKGSSGADNIVGSPLDEEIDAGAGNDYVLSQGYDTYKFGIGDGQDVLEATYGVVSFKAGINQNDIVFTKDGKDLIATVSTSGDTVRIKNWVEPKYYWQRIDRFEFDNGTVLDANQVLTALNQGDDSEILFGSPNDDLIQGTDKNSQINAGAGNDTLNGGLGADTLAGEDGDDSLNGGEGNDTLNGSIGNDTLDGGAGRDWLNAGEGQNTYIVSRGMGLDTIEVVTTFANQPNDTVQFADGITLDDISVQLGYTSYGDNPNNITLTGYSSLVIGIGGNDALMLQTNWQDLALGGVQHFRFADGTELSLADIVGLADDGKVGEQYQYDRTNVALIGSQADDVLNVYGSYYNWAQDDVGYNIQARGNNDRIRLYTDGNVVSAGAGDDEISSTFGNQLIAGEGGDDVISTGEYDNDSDAVIVFNYGDGSDTINVQTGGATLLFGANVTLETISVFFDGAGELTLSVAGGAGGSIKIANSDSKNITGNLQHIAFVDASGNTRTFDFANWAKANKTALYNATAQTPTTIDFASFDLTGKVAPKGGLEALAYAQTGNLFATPNLANNTLSSGNDVYYGTQTPDTIDGLAGNDIILGLAGDDEITGGDGNDILSGGAGEDYLEGGIGDDILQGGNGADVLSGGTGNDQLFGGRGGDSYLFNLGDGTVTIEDSHMVRMKGGEEAFSAVAFNGDGYGGYLNYSVDNDPNILNFADISYADVTFSSVDGDLVLTINGHPNDKVILKGYNANRATLTNSIDIIRFADGEELIDNNVVIQGVVDSLGDDGGRLNGTEFADTLVGGDGDDQIYGNGDSDNLVGKAGSDDYNVTVDYDSSETVIYEIANNQDFNRLNIDGYANPEDLRLEFDGTDLMLRINANNTIRFAGFDPRQEGMLAPVSWVSLPDYGVEFTFDELLAKGISYRNNVDSTYTVNIGDGDVQFDFNQPNTGNVLRFGEGITPETFYGNLRFEAADNGGYSLLLHYGDVSDVVRIDGLNPQDVLNSEHAIDYVEFSDGSIVDYDTLVSWGFYVEGDDVDNDLSGTNLVDSIAGQAGNDYLYGNEGSDLLDGGIGNDVLTGGAGDDGYVFNIGDGFDTIVDSGDNDYNYISFGADIQVSDVYQEQSGNALIIHYGQGDAIRIEDYFLSQGNPTVLVMTFDDGTVLPLAELTNQAPNQTAFVDDTFAAEDTPFVFTLPEDLFEDANVLDEISLNVRLANGEALPAWLSYNAVTKTFSGTPTNDDVGELSIVVEARDHFNATTEAVFVLTVENTNDAPTVSLVLAGQTSLEDATFSYEIPENAFADVDVGDTLIYDVSLSSGDPLPSWLSYNATTKTISGTPMNEHVGNISLKVTVTDVAGTSANQTFTLNVENTNDAPSVSVALIAQSTLEDTAFSYTIPANAFTDVDAGDSLSYTLTLADGNPLPSWLNFDVNARAISGTPINSDVGSVVLKVTAIDLVGTTVSQNFNLTVENTNDAPTILVALAGQGAIEDASFSYTIPADAFADVDVGDALNYIVTLADGSPLPSWLSFDINTRTISGLPTNSEVGLIAIKVSATDIAGASASQNFDLAVTNTNDEPIVAVAIAAQTALEDSSFTFTIPSDAFTEIDAGDTLTYNATLEDGSALPSWLSFDATTRTYSGTPANSEVGLLNIQVTATDNAGANISQVFNLTVQNTNDAPNVGVILAAQLATEDATFSYAISASAFEDIDVGDSLNYNVSLSNGDSLPNWLNYNATTKTLSGTPTNNDVGNLNLKITATDIAGLSANQTFTLNVENTNDAPNVSVAIAAQAAIEDAAFSYQIPVNAFNDVDVGDSLSYSISLANGNPLPTWLSFDANTRTISGAPTNNDVGSVVLKVTATDVAGTTTSQNFDVIVANTNDAPTISVAISSQTATEDAVFSYVIPANAFADIDTDDNLTFSFTLDSGSELPSWLSYNSATKTLSGTPTNGEVGTLALKVTATDIAGLSANQTFMLNVENINDAPTVFVAIAAQTASEDAAFSYVIPANAFTDVDVNDTLSYGVTLSNDNPLPSWLSYNATTRTISGTPSNSEVGSLSFKVTATDVAGATASQNFNLTVVNTNDAPTVSVAIADTTANTAQAFSYVLPANTFADVDVNDTLSYTATLSDGSTLPAWLSFNASTRTFSGTPTTSGTVSVKVIASDEGNLSASDTFNITITSLNQTINGTSNADTLNGGAGNDTINGLAGNDTLNGNAGNDNLDGGAGCDTMNGGLGNDTYIVDHASDVVNEAVNAGVDTVNVAIDCDSAYTLAANIENATLINTVAFTLKGNALDNILTGNAAANTLNGGDGNDTLNGLAGNDTMLGGLGNDTYTIDVTGDVITEASNAGTDSVNVAINNANGTYTVATNVENALLTNTVAYNLTGNALANFLKGNAANNTLTDTAGGNDILQGLAGNDTLKDTVGNNLFDGGIGNDVITGGSGREIFIAGQGNDTITTGTGYDVINFNRGDGADVINASTGADNTLSLGGNFAYGDLSLSKSSNNLILKMGATDQITLKDWYASGTTNKSVVNLQVIAEAIQGFNLGSADNLRNNKIENFNFTNLVAAFDAAGATANWQLTDARLTTHLQAGSDSAAIGGDLAYQYGKNSNLTGMGLASAQSVIAAASFGQSAQTLNNQSVWQAEVVKLA